jgi:hypothetical protein
MLALLYCYRCMPPSVCRLLRWLTYAFVVIAFVFEARVIIDNLERPGIHHHAH